MRDPIKNGSVLITGGAGFIGSHLADAVLDAGAREVVVVDNLFLGETRNLEQARARGAVLYRDDCEFAVSLDYIFERHEIDVVFNCATKALNYSFLNPSQAFSTNTTVVLNLLEQQRKGAFKSLVHFSTSEVYGTAVYEPMDEVHPKNPTTTYAGGKLAADVAVDTYVHMFGLDAVIVRPFNNYGPRQNHKGLLAGVIPITVSRILAGEPPQIHGDGAQKRDFIHVKDTVDCTLKLYEAMKPGDSVNVASAYSIEISRVIEMICEFMNYHGDIVRMPARGSDVVCHDASNAKMHALIDHEFISFEQGLRDTIVWYVNALQESGR